MKKNFLTFSILFIFFLMLAKMDITKAYALKGLNLWLFSVLPTLLPFTIISSILLCIGAFTKPLQIIKKLTKTNFNEHIPLIIICGLFCGCPIGTKLSADTYKQGYLSHKTATFILCSLNCLSPAFIINYALPTYLSINLRIKLYILIIISNIIAAYIIVRIFSIQNNNLPNKLTSNTYIKQNKEKHTPSITDIFETCILSSFEIQCKIGGYIIIFSCISGIFIQTLHLNSFTSLVFNSLLEISSGLGSYNSFAFNNHYIALITALISFGGVCTICQMFSCIKDVDISKNYLIYSKVLSGILTYFFTYILLN